MNMSTGVFIATHCQGEVGTGVTVVSDPTVNVAPVIGATPDVTPAVWSSGASDTVRWEMADTDAGPWSTVDDMPAIDTPYTDQTFGKVLRWVEAQGGVTAESAATAPVAMVAPAITPTLGSQLIVNGNMETGSPPSSYLDGGATPTSVADERTGGAGTKSVQLTRGAGQAATAFIYQQVLGGSAGLWFQAEDWMKNIDASNASLQIFNAAHPNPPASASASWTNIIYTDRLVGSTVFVRPRYTTSAEGQAVRHDDLSFKFITFSSMRVELGDIGRSTGTFTCHPTIANYTAAGLLINYTDDSNFVLAYVIRHDAITDIAYLVKHVAGVSTSVISGNVSYVAGNALEVRVSGTSYSLYYNGVQVGTTQTISDTLGTKVCAFNSYAGNEVGLVETDPLAA